MVGLVAIKQGRSANRKHTFFFCPKAVSSLISTVVDSVV